MNTPPDLKRCAEELGSLEDEDKEPAPIEKPITAQITWNIAIALIRCIQFTARYGEDEDDQIAKAVCFAKKLQDLLDVHSDLYAELNLGWNPNEALVEPVVKGDRLQNFPSEEFPPESFSL